MRGFHTCLLAAGLSIAGPAFAASTCDALAVPPSAMSRASDARLVRTSGQSVRPANISYVLAQPGWRVIWATPKDAERGVFFFRRAGAGYRLIETWGGVIAPSEREGTIAWARRLRGGGPSLRLARCFVAALLAGK